MKKTLALLIVLTLLTVCMPAFADVSGEHFVIASPTAMNGAFFSGMWGNNASDIDVRTLLHGYSPVVWTMQSLFEIDETVVEEVTVGLLANGNKAYEIKLHEDLTYNDGTAITASDYVFSLLLQASPAIAELGGNTNYSAHLAGHEAYEAGTAEVFSGVRLLDTYTYAIEINDEYLPFFYELGMLECYPYPIAAIAPGCKVADDGEGAYIASSDTASAASPFTASLLRETILGASGYLSSPQVTSGPYQLESYNTSDNTATFSINPRYKGNHEGQKPAIDNLKLVHKAPEDMVSAYESGEVDLLNKCVEADVIDAAMALVTESQAGSSSYARMGFGFISFSCEQGPTQFEAVRKAVAYALDTTDFCNQYTSLNYGIPVYGYYGIGQWMVQLVMNPSTSSTLESAVDEEVWSALTLDGLETYDKNLDTAKTLLVEDGWTLNASGDAFQEGVDDVRYKTVDGSLMALELRYGKLKDSQAAQLLEDMLVEPLAELGMVIEPVETEFPQLLEQYYRQEDRDLHMMYLATNFTNIFDPYYVFNSDPQYDGTQNTTGYHDAELEALALALRQTEPGDLLTYCQRWLAFQTYWNEKLPMLPLYSNMYFDFYIPQLQGYLPNTYMNWPTAILYAYLGEAGAAEAGDGTALQTIEDVG